ncbi:hypothetical protein CG723_29345, partial [Streptomyces sp. CB01635]
MTEHPTSHEGRRPAARPAAPADPRGALRRASDALPAQQGRPGATASADDADPARRGPASGASVP